MIVGKVKRIQQLEKGKGKGAAGGPLEEEMNSAQAALQIAEAEAEEVTKVQQKKQKDLTRLNKEVAQLKDALVQANTRYNAFADAAPTGAAKAAMRGSRGSIVLPATGGKNSAAAGSLLRRGSSVSKVR